VYSGHYVWYGVFAVLAQVFKQWTDGFMPPAINLPFTAFGKGMAARCAAAGIWGFSILAFGQTYRIAELLSTCPSQHLARAWRPGVQLQEKLGERGGKDLVYLHLCCTSVSLSSTCPFTACGKGMAAW
jgi:hypothetical protein